MKDELDGLGEEETNNTSTELETKETPEQMVARLEAENKKLRDGNTDFGRKFKSFQEDYSNQMNTVMDKLNQLSSAPQKQNDVVDDYEDEDEKRVRRIAREEAIRQKEEADKLMSQAREKYIKEYSKAVQSLGSDLDVDVYEEIIKKMEGMPGYSSDGAMDAERNFLKAERDYYRTINAKKTTHAFKEQDTKGTGVGGASAVAAKEPDEGDIDKAMQDPHVQAFLKRTGKDKDFVKKALKNSKQTLSGKIRI
jgi:uncharacterized protein YukE